MKIKYLCTMWGMDRPVLEDNFNLIKDAGFDGIEMQVSGNSVERDRMGVLLNERELDLIVQVRAEGSTVAEQIDSLVSAAHYVEQDRRYKHSFPRI